MKNILLLTTTPTAGGNGDALIAAAKEEAEKNGAEIHLVNIREKQIGFCRACYGCAETGFAAPSPANPIRSGRKNASVFF